MNRMPAGRLRRCAGALRILVLVSPWVVPAPAVGAEEGELDRLVHAAVEAHRLPSLSVAVWRDGVPLYVGARGLADLENDVQATVRTVYPLGSITKTITATAAMILAERELLDLDAPVQHHCPAFPVKSQPVTTRQLLAHLGGVRHYDYGRFEEDFLNRRSFASIAEAIGKFAADPLVAEPGATHHYSSWGYVVVGCVLEGVAGTSYAALVEDLVLRPAGTTQTRLDAVGPLVPHRARGYARSATGEWVNAGLFDASDRIPAGGLAGTPTDLARFGQALLEGRLVAAPTRSAMWTRQTTTAGEAIPYGLGWGVSEDGEEVVHGGTSVGATGYLLIRPHHGVVVALLTNLSLWTEGREELASVLADLATASGDPN